MCYFQRCKKLTNGLVNFTGIFGQVNTLDQNDLILFFTFIPRTWFQNHLKALGYKQVVKPTKTDPCEESYNQMKLTTIIVTNKIPVKLKYFLHICNMVLKPTETDPYEESYDQMKLMTIIITNKIPGKFNSSVAPLII